MPRVLHDLEPDDSVAGHHRRICEGVDEQAIEVRMAVVDDDLPPTLERNPDDPCAEPFHRRELRGRSVVRHDHGAGDAPPFGVPCHALSHVPGGRRVDAVRQRRRVGQGHRIPGAAELERADWLQVLELRADLNGLIWGEVD